VLTKELVLNCSLCELKCLFCCPIKYITDNLVGWENDIAVLLMYYNLMDREEKTTKIEIMKAFDKKEVWN